MPGLLVAAAATAVSMMFKLIPLLRLALALECRANVIKVFVPRRLLVNPKSMLACNVIDTATRAMHEVWGAIGGKDV